MAQGASEHSSPTSTKGKLSATQIEIIPLDSPLRVQPIHPDLPTIKLSAIIQSINSEGGQTNSLTGLNPLTLQSFTPEELAKHGFETLQEQYPSPDAAEKARTYAVMELKQRLEENERRARDIEREMEEKEKTREIERKVYMKKLSKETG